MPGVSGGLVSPLSQGMDISLIMKNANKVLIRKLRTFYTALFANQEA